MDAVVSNLDIGSFDVAKVYLSAKLKAGAMDKLRNLGKSDTISLDLFENLINNFQLPDPVAANGKYLPIHPLTLT